MKRSGYKVRGNVLIDEIRQRKREWHSIEF